MSLANAHLEPAREPLVTRLGQGRLRVERWLNIKDRKLGRQTELTLQIFGGYDLLDGTTPGTEHEIHALYPNQAFANCRLIDEKTDEVFLPGGISIFQLYQRYETLTSTWALEDAVKPRSTESGLRQLEQVQLARPGTAAPYNEDQVGTSTLSNGGKTLYLAGFDDDSDDRRGRFITRWAEAGLLSATKQFDNDSGILYVRFTSQGLRIRPTALKAGESLAGEAHIIFRNGEEAPLYRARAENVEGFMKFETVVMLNKDGTPLSSGDTVKQYIDWDTYNYPGPVDSSFGGITPYPGGEIAVLVEYSETLTTDATVVISSNNPVPYSIKGGAWVNVSFTPEATGMAEFLTKAFTRNLLARDVVFSGNNTTYLNDPVSSVAGSGGSNPSYAGFLNATEPVLKRKIHEDITTDEGVQWYRIKQTKLVGKFSDYL